MSLEGYPSKHTHLFLYQKNIIQIPNFLQNRPAEWFFFLVVVVVVGGVVCLEALV